MHHIIVSVSLKYQHYWVRWSIVVTLKPLLKPDIHSDIKTHFHYKPYVITISQLRFEWWHDFLLNDVVIII